LIIFNLAYDELEDSIDPDYWLYHDSVERILSPSLYPYNIAAVCSLWRDIASLVPKFWRYVVIFVDITPLSAVASQLSWSCDLAIDVVITRKVFHGAVDARHEREQVVAIMNILGPQIHRLRELHFDVMFSSSLPSFPHDFHGAAPILLYLALQCREEMAVPSITTNRSIRWHTNRSNVPSSLSSSSMVGIATTFAKRTYTGRATLRVFFT
jgi:hypothetical protein